MTTQHHQSQTQGTCVQYPCNITASAQLKCNCDQYPCNSVAYVQLKWGRKKTNSDLILWKEGSLRNGMKYQDGNLTILSKGLYFINCRLHFIINKCLETHDFDLYTKLVLNGIAVYEVLTTVLPTNSSYCRIYKDQHLSLHIELNPSDNLSVHTRHPEWLNEEHLAESILFEAFKIQYK
ncbi:tumor necrosis factor ligand superfamily member 8 [Bufo bufo]|uniref:tumor necrosis factor ligand superfamily member 8 n=1 Tax=Bufo bufo TaxID=8384 RepID=UPI001ABE309C|nr:tumor necrosis factor ligand superfamily member 8 [Bufo bufo]